MNHYTKILSILGESAGAVFFAGLLAGSVWSFVRWITTRILTKIGVDYFSEINESYRWIGQILIESRAKLNADRVCFYRTSNGKVFIENADDYDANDDIQIYSIVNVTKNKSISPLPDKLTRRYLDWFLEIQKSDDYLERFTPDLPMESPLRNILIKHGVIAYMAVKVKFYSDLYGIIVFTWADVSLVPKNLDMKNREYLEDIKNAVLIETIFIISRSFRFHIQEFLQNIYSFLSRKKQ